LAGVDGITVSTESSIRAAGNIPPQLGLHYVQALEDTSGGSGVTFYGGLAMNLSVVVEM
jgi:hypothetical protein